jgi:hypothetical protein
VNNFEVQEESGIFEKAIPHRRDLVQQCIKIIAEILVVLKVVARTNFHVT